MSDGSAEPQGLPQYHCPGCGEVVIPAALGQCLLQCPQCGQQFFASTEEVGAHEAQTLDYSSAQRPEEPLSAVRIRQVSGLRRAAYRSRSWVIIAAGVCLIAGVKLAITVVLDIRGGLRAGPIGYGLAAVALFMIGGYLVRQASEMTRRIRQSRQLDPPDPPDLSSLSDGSQRWKNLEDLPRDKP